VALAGLAFRRGLLAASECHQSPPKYGTLNAWLFLRANLNQQPLLKLLPVAMLAPHKLATFLRTPTA
jgi:adenosylcobinamide amidohydrolase